MLHTPHTLFIQEDLSRVVFPRVLEMNYVQWDRSHEERLGKFGGGKNCSSACTASPQVTKRSRILKNSMEYLRRTVFPRAAVVVHPGKDVLYQVFIYYNLQHISYHLFILS